MLGSCVSVWVTVGVCVRVELWFVLRGSCVSVWGTLEYVFALSLGFVLRLGSCVSVEFRLCVGVRVSV